MRDWLLPLLRCDRCRGSGLGRHESELLCAGCGARYPAPAGIPDFLDPPHPTVAREIAAIASLDSREPAARARIAELLRDLDRGTARADDPRLDEFPSFREHFVARGRARGILERYPPPAGGVAVELGADHCLLSGLLLDAGCRVVAVDISDHLELAPRAGSERLARIRADMHRLPLADGVADLVWATACVHHAWSLTGALREARRVLRPTGRLVLLSEPMPAWPRYLLFGMGRRFAPEQRALGINETLHPRRAWLRAARAAGFEPRLHFPEPGGEAARSLVRRLRSVLRSEALVQHLVALLQVSIHLVAEPSPPREAEAVAGPRQSA